jgi:hypothetical protein
MLKLTLILIIFSILAFIITGLLIRMLPDDKLDAIASRTDIFPRHILICGGITLLIWVVTILSMIITIITW